MTTAALVALAAFCPPHPRKSYDPSIFPPDSVHHWIENEIFTVMIQPANMRNGTIIYSYGNQDNTHACVLHPDTGEKYYWVIDKAIRIANHTNMAVVLWDYPGDYTPRRDNTPSSCCFSSWFVHRPTMETFFKYADHVLKYYHHRVKGNPLFLWGRSLGTTIPCYLADNYQHETTTLLPWNGIVLESPLLSALRQAGLNYNDKTDPLLEWMDALNNLGEAERSGKKWGPVYIVCGTEDTITPPANAKMLQKNITGAIVELVHGADHSSDIVEEVLLCHENKLPPLRKWFISHSAPNRLRYRRQ